MRERERESKRLRRFVINFSLIFALLLQNFLFLVNPVYAASSPWTQTDWVGGSGQTSWSDITKFDSSSSVVTSTSGQLTLSTNTEKLSNTGFETDLTGWTSADSLVSAYWKTDESSGNATDSSDSGNTATITGSSNYASGKIGNGLRTGIATTNLFTNPSFETTVGDWSFDPKTGGAVSQYSTDLYKGTKSAKLTAPSAGGDSAFWQSLASSASTAYTLSVWIKNINVSSVPYLWIRERNSGGSVTLVNQQNVTGMSTTAWQRYTFSITSRSDTATIDFGIRIPANALQGDILVDAFQAQQASAATPYVDGSLGTGYSWTGTANASTSTRVASTATTTTNINDSTGSISFWFKSPGLDTTSQCPMGSSDGNTTGGVFIALKNNGIFVTHAYASGVTVAPQYSSTLSDNTFYHVVYTWDNSTKKGDLYVNNSLAQEVDYAQDITTGEYLQNLGTCTKTGYTTFNGIIDEIGVWSKALSTTEISNLYNSGNGRQFPFYTTTRDTTTTYGSSSGAAKIIAGNTANFTQSVNVGNTNNYNLSAYAYTTSAAVTLTDVELFYNGSTISTTYTSVGSGWYQLSGTITGTNASRNYGVQIKAGKTVYLDNFSLNNYTSSGTLTSSIFDAEWSANWGTLTYTSPTPTNTTTSVKLRTSDNSDMNGATAFSSCTAISSGSDISSNSCVTDGHRYIQYQIALSNTDTSATPTFQDFLLTFANAISPTGSISINSGATYTTSRNVTLTLSASDDVDSSSALEIEVSESSDFSGASYEAFSASKSFTLSTGDGTKTVYARFRDSASNVSSTYSDTIILDTTNPVSIDLDSPGDNSYTNNERPSFKWKATTDATAGLSKYVLEIDNPSIGSSQPSGDFTIDNIPTSGTTDITINNKYVIHFDGFSDSDSTNNYISVYTRSTNDWGSSENDGKLREGRVSWKVKAVDNAGNEISSSRTLFVDRSNPKVELTQINDVPFSSTNFSTTDKTPTIFGKITDPLAGGDSSQTQDENGPKIASGPKQVDIKVEKKEGIGYKLITLYTINMDKPWYTCDNKEVTDNSKQKCDKYLPFEYTSKENLELGTYKITLTGKDKADNSSSETTLSLNTTTLAQITTPEEKKIIEEGIKPLKPEEQEKVKEELEITKPVEPSALEKAGEQISQTSKNILNTTGNIISGIFNGIGNGVRFTVDITGKALAFVGDKTGQALAFVGKTTSNTLAALYNSTQSILAYVGQGIGSGANAIGQGLAWAGEKIGQGVSSIAQGTENLIASIGQGIGNTGKAIGDGYNQLANNAPGVAKTILTGIGNGVSATTSTIATIVQNTASTIGNATNTITTATSITAKNTGYFIAGIASNVGKTTSSIAQNTSKTIGNIASTVTNTTSTVIHNAGSAIANATQNTVKATKNGIANLAFSIGEKTDDVSHGLGTAIIKIGYLFVPEPTKIANVRVAKSTPTSMTITWETNHPANGKVNYGLTADYGRDVQSDKRITQHEFTVTGLKPNTTYYYEVMSQNRNYVYDANHTFTTPKE